MMTILALFVLATVGPAIALLLMTALGWGEILAHERPVAFALALGCAVMVVALIAHG